MFRKFNCLNLLAFLIVFSNAVFAQDDFNKWSVGLNIGSHDGMWPTKKLTKSYQIHHYALQGRYMLNNRFGFKTDLAYNFLDATKSGNMNVNYWRISFSAVANLGDILKFHTFSNRFGLLAHAGFGVSTMYVANKARFDLDLGDPYLEGKDDMINYVFGISPQFKLNERISLNLSTTLILHHLQSRSFDWLQPNKHKPIDGYFFNSSLGVTVYLGKNKSHADWIPTIHTSESNKYFEEKIRQLEERTKDDDKDGVPNYLDLEPNTPEGTYVDSKGQTIKDSDEDGILDSFDMCPNDKGLSSNNGCPDKDSDGIPDPNDNCPDVPGLVINKGCPDIAKETEDALKNALENVEFFDNSSVLTDSSYLVLDEVIKELKAHQEYNLLVEGHTDDIGSDKFNLVLSERRAVAVETYLISKGIDADRIIIKSYGESRPIASNKTPEGRAQNRRVEFRIIF
jgi:OOP family OmpA-OmpF porin